MTGSPNILYSPYGAYELKARYQTNLMLAMLITASMVGLALLGAWVHGQFSPDDVIIPVNEPIVLSVVDLPLQQLNIKHKGVPTTDVQAAAPVVGIPVPVPIDEAPDENMVIASQLEIADLLNNNRPGILDGDGRGIVIDPNVVVDEPDPFEVTFVEILPEMIHRYVPPYPRLAKMAGITGAVWVRALVNEEGNVSKAIVHATSGTQSLDDAAVEAAYKNKFKPGIQNGRPVKCWVSYKVVFDLEH